MTQLQINIVRLGIITVISHSYSLNITLIGVNKWLIERRSKSQKTVM